MVNSRQLPQTPTSFGGLFTSCKSQGQQSNTSDIEVYRQSYLEADNNQTYRNTPRTPDISVQEQFYRNLQTQQAKHAAERLYVQSQDDQVQDSLEPHGQNVVVQNQQHDSFQQFQGATDEPQFGRHSGESRYQGPREQQQPEYPVLQPPVLAQSNNIDQQNYAHTDTKAQPYQMGGNGQYLSPTGYRRDFAVDQHMAAEQLASELVKTYGGQNSHM